MNQKDISLSFRSGSTPAKIYLFLHDNYPGIYTPGLISSELGLKISTVRKSCSRLLSKGYINRPPGNKNAKHGFYMAFPSSKNCCGLEDPNIEIHNLVFQVSIDKRTFKGDTPPALYTHCPVDYASRFDFVFSGVVYGVRFQFNQNNTITVYCDSSKFPFDEVTLYSYYSWLNGVLGGFGVNPGLVRFDCVRFDANRDFKRICVTPKMFEFRDLLKKGTLRIYNKYADLTRLEVSTTFKGDKEIYELFKNFGRIDKTPKDILDMDYR